MIRPNIYQGWRELWYRCGQSCPGMAWRRRKTKLPKYQAWLDASNKYISHTSNLIYSLQLQVGDYLDMSKIHLGNHSAVPIYALLKHLPIHYWSLLRLWSIPLCLQALGTEKKRNIFLTSILEHNQVDLIIFLFNAKIFRKCSWKNHYCSFTRDTVPGDWFIMKPITHTALMGNYWTIVQLTVLA